MTCMCFSVCSSESNRISNYIIDDSFKTTVCLLFECIAMYIGEDDERYDNQLCIEDLQEVFSLLIKAARDWFNIGLALGIKVGILEGIESNENSDKARLREMLTHWLRSSPSCTWSDICKCLRSDTVQQNNLADTIKEKYKGNYKLYTALIVYAC